MKQCLLSQHLFYSVFCCLSLLKILWFSLDLEPILSFIFSCANLSFYFDYSLAFIAELSFLSYLETLLRGILDDWTSWIFGRPEVWGSWWYFAFYFYFDILGVNFLGSFFFFYKTCEWTLYLLIGILFIIACFWEMKVFMASKKY